jgi:type I site-specific restriction endonuclease
MAVGLLCWGEADTWAKLIDPAIHARGWTENLIRREKTAGAIEIVDGKATAALRHQPSRPPSQ